MLTEKFINIDKESIDAKNVCRMNVLESKDDVSKTSQAIQVLLKYQRKWLAGKLKGTARVRITDDTIGLNIRWYINETWENAYDRVTGRKIRLKQVLFEGPVELKLFDQQKEWTVTVQGTTENVLEKIYMEYQPVSEEIGPVFEALSKEGDKKYSIDLGS